MGSPLIIEDFEEIAPIRFTPRRPVTDDDFIALCQRFEHYDVEVSAEGEVSLLPMPYTKTSRKNARVVFQLTRWSDQDGRGDVFGPDGDIVLPNTARKRPDAFWIRKDRIAAQPEWQQETFYRLAPDFVIEIRSSWDRLNRLKTKMEEYITNGVQLGWLIDPEEKTVWIYRPNREPERLDNPSSVVGEGPVEGFVLDLTEVWS
jgi:Uma2 family endonuclease